LLIQHSKYGAMLSKIHFSTPQLFRRFSPLGSRPEGVITQIIVSMHFLVVSLNAAMLFALNIVFHYCLFQFFVVLHEERILLEV